jgi:hypothetical protein
MSSFVTRLATVFLLALNAPQALATAFVDATSAAGLAGYVQHGLHPAEACLAQSHGCIDRMSGGAAVADYDGDGDLDLFATVFDGADKLFQNQGNGTFLDVAAAAGLAAYSLQSNGAVFADLDNDGDQDLFVTVIGGAADPVNNRNYLFVNNGNGTFSEDAVARGAALASGSLRAGWSIAVGDYDRDGWLDLFVSEWRPDSLGGGSASHARLLHNLGPAQPGHFEDATAASEIDLEAISVSPDGVYAFAPAFIDLDRNGWPDLAIASDFGTSRLYWNDGDGTFSDGTVHARVGTDENGMGSTFGDLDGDGDFEWFVTSIHDADETCEAESCDWGYSGNRLYEYQAGRRFSDATDEYGVREGHWGWGAAFFDWQNDGDLDLVMTNGIDFPGDVDAPFNADPMRLWTRAAPGQPAMSEVSAAEGVVDTGSGKGLLVFDYDGDGDQDIFVVNNGAAPVLYRNTVGQSNDWLRVRVQGVDVNRDGIGSRVTVTATPGGISQVREVGVGSHFAGQSERVAHFGLALPCDNGLDDDGDGWIDAGEDLGCSDLVDPSEKSPFLVCDDGLDQDQDGLIDYPADPGCGATFWAIENPECQDGLDNDHQLGIDFDGGASLNGGLPVAVPDPNCAGAPHRNREAPLCGLGFEVGLLLPLFLLAHRRRVLALAPVAACQ